MNGLFVSRITFSVQFLFFLEIHQFLNVFSSFLREKNIICVNLHGTIYIFFIDKNRRFIRKWLKDHSICT